MDVSEIHKSGIIRKGEDLIECKEGYMTRKGNGVLAITNRRFLFLKKPGFFSKGYHIISEWHLESIASITITGLISKRLNVQAIVDVGLTNIFQFNIGSSDETEIFKEKLIGAKEEFIDEITVEAEKIIVAQGKKDDSIEILKKRLARGEITLDEFHQKIQRL